MKFLEQDDDAKLWGGTPEEFTNAPDCNVLAERFAWWVMANYGKSADVVVVDMVAATDDIGGGPHWFTVIDGVAFDWTARQFHNVLGMPLAYDEIPSPLLFLWPGPYPLPMLEAFIPVRQPW